MCDSEVCVIMLSFPSFPGVNFALTTKAELEGVGQREWEERTSEERWDSNWRTAAEKVKDLYT